MNSSRAAQSTLRSGGAPEINVALAQQLSHLGPDRQDPWLIIGSARSGADANSLTSPAPTAPAANSFARLRQKKILHIDDYATTVARDDLARARMSGPVGQCRISVVRAARTIVAISEYAATVGASTLWNGFLVSKRAPLFLLSKRRVGGCPDAVRRRGPG